MIKNYKKAKKETIKAIKWTGDNTDEIIKFGTYKVGDTEYHDIELPPESTFIRKSQPQLWISNWYGGDIILINEYAGLDGEYIKLTEEDLKDYKQVSYDTYEKEDKEIYSAIQWTGDNSDEIKEFLAHNGNLESSGQQFIIMNTIGGCVCNKNDFVIKIEDKDFFYSLDEKAFKDNFVETQI